MSTMFHSGDNEDSQISKISREQQIQELRKILADVFALPDGDSTDRFFVLSERINELEAENRRLTEQLQKSRPEDRSYRIKELDAKVRGRDQLWRYLTFFTLLVFGSLLFLSFQWRDDPYWIKTMALICSAVFSVGAFRIFGRLSIEVGPNGRLDVGGEYSRHSGTETKND